VYLTGDGNSYHAACAAEMAFESLADVPYEPLSALRILAGYIASYLAVRLNRLPFQAGQHPGRHRRPR